MSSSPPSVAPAAPAATPSSPAAPTPWPPWTAAAAFLVAVGGTLLFASVVQVAAIAGGSKQAVLPHWVGIVSSYGEEAILVACALGFARLHGRIRATQLGLRAPGTPLEALALLMATGLAVFAFGKVWQSIAQLTQQQDPTKSLGVDDGAGGFIGIAVLVCVVAPIAEETFFRGYFFGALRNWRGVWPAAVITGLVFGAVHIGSYPLAYLPPLAFLGFGLCLLRARTGSLYPCIALHALNNGLAFALLRHWTTLPVIATMLAALLAVSVVVLGVVRFSQRNRALSNTMTA